MVYGVLVLLYFLYIVILLTYFVRIWCVYFSVSCFLYSWVRSWRMWIYFEFIV